MHLHLTILSRWVDSIPIDPLLRKDKTYMQDLKQILKNRNKALLEASKTEGEFYLDPINDKYYSLATDTH